MGDADISTSQWRLVETGRVVLFSTGPYKGRLAVIVEIIDHKREGEEALRSQHLKVLVDGPSETASKAVPRSGAVKAAWEKAEVEGKWENSTWAKNRDRMAKRRQLNDFEKFKVMRLRKQARFEVQKSLAKVRASAKA
ncbi:hypothetical protein H2199_008382 [Coniosporium tulheliwenetii]|uniref:Uncharacterized protein n=1 Tax=Coniosporium tulheliwenetii TaxID=3383036 RepID=A0ACC2YJA3_9PEZI|nr:hypothetical protein H2199_008382 [Cladosporium sp. JES 115]